MPTIKTNEIFANRYKLIKQLGIGGYSEVWLAEDQYAGNMEVAVKIYAPGKGLDEDGLKTFGKEYTTVFNLNNAHLLKPMHYDVCEGSPYLVLQYCKNGSLYQKIGKFTEADVAGFLIEACEAIAYLHKKEPPIIHQDIKPDNFLIDEDGNYLLADFGISSKIRRTLTRSIGEKASTGTMAYMPPEKFNEDRQAIKAGDIFSLGVCMFELLTGELAFGDLGGLALKSGADLPKLLESFSKELNSIIRSCLAKDPWDRPTAEMLMEIAKNYELIGKWDITKLPKVKQQMHEEPIIKPVKQENRETVQKPVNEIENKKELPIAKQTSDSYGKYFLIFGFVVVLIFTIIYFSKNRGPSAEEKAAAEQAIIDSIEAAGMQRLVDTIEVADRRINKDVSSVENQQNSNSTDNWQANYDKVYAFAFGRAVVMKNGKYGYVDTNGKLVIPVQYQDAFDFRKEGLALVKKKGLFGFIDKNGNLNINFYYEKAKSFENGKAYVYSEGDGWYYIDTDGNKLNPSQKISITQQKTVESKTNIQNLKIGDTYAGGIIFYIDESGKHGKICSLSDDRGNVTWENAKLTSFSMKTGYGWYIPSKNDLYLMYINLHSNALGDFANDFYWSSSDLNDNAFGINFSNGNEGFLPKYYSGRIRAIRIF